MATNTKDALWNSGRDESVEVNQRALIDKILARYSGEFTVFRELLQNADDACSAAVEIRFETKKYIELREKSGADRPSFAHRSSSVRDERLPDLKTALVHRWTLKNNGMIFREEDWSRLKRIAEGNPDEEKIGAFGVGFYSLFSITEEPFVTSGGQWMGFHWKDKKDQLFARRGHLTNKTSDPWTVFEMDLREPAPVPPVFEFARFLVSAITFKTHLREISVYFDDKRLVCLTKDVGVPKQLAMPQGLKNTSAMGFMTIKDLEATPVRITVEGVSLIYSFATKTKQFSAVKKLKHKRFLSSFFGSSESNILQQTPSLSSPQQPRDEAEDLRIDQSSVMLTIFAANVDVSLDTKLAAEVQRSTKKNAPRTLKYELIYTEKDEYDASKRDEDERFETTDSIFQGLRADLDGSDSARIFIGHATSQTTGLGGHMAARFIPTVERESIDLVDRNIAVWNKELLYIGGFLSRSIYEREMQEIESLWGACIASDPEESLEPGSRRQFYDKAGHNLQFFTFRNSTPSTAVSHEMRSVFFDCVVDDQPFPVISSAGIRSALEVRKPDPKFGKFLKKLPVFPEELWDDSRLMVAALRERGMLKVITFGDVLNELQERPLSEEEMVACLKWWIETKTPTTREQLLDVARLAAGFSDDGEERIIPLKDIQTFLGPRLMSIPKDGPLPSHLLPIGVSQKFTSSQLQVSLKWKEFTILRWVQHIVDPAVYAERNEFNIAESPFWAERVLQFLSKSWLNLSTADKSGITKLINELTCIPTSAGMKKPNETYFPSAGIFRDIPIVKFPSGTRIRSNLEKMLVWLGVRKYVDLEVIYNRVIGDGDWTTPDLVRFLVSVPSVQQPTGSSAFYRIAAFHAEKVLLDDDDGAPKKFMASELYEPLDVFRDLGLPVIDWHGKEGRWRWRSYSKEARFLFCLGLQRHPSPGVVLGIAARGGPRGTLAFHYFLDNFRRKYSWSIGYGNYLNIAFVPAIHKGEKKLLPPSQIFSNPDWHLLGLPVMDPSLRRDAVNKLRIKEHPPTSRLVTFLKDSPPTTESEAREWFGLFSRRIRDFPVSELNRLCTMPIIPIPEAAPNLTGSHLLCPNQCYFSGGSHPKLHYQLFVFVDFGASANSFLKACGVKGEPSAEDIALVLSNDPQRFFQLTRGWDDYLAELCRLAINSRFLTSSTVEKLKEKKILVGSRRIRREKSDKATDLSDEEAWNLEYDLLTPDEVVIADDMITFQQFGEELFCAPQEDILEEFYQFLGCKRLGDLVQEEYQTIEEIHGYKKSQEVRSLILERLPLFLHEHTYVAPQVSLDWLNDEKNFVVQTFKKVTVTRNISFGGANLSKTIEASAISRREGEGEIQLCLAHEVQVDMYEVATSLCHLLFKTNKVIDALLFMTMLSTDLDALQRRGYNVNQILKQHKAEKAEKEKVEQAEKEKAEQAEKEASA